MLSSKPVPLRLPAGYRRANVLTPPRRERAAKVMDVLPGSLRETPWPLLAPVAKPNVPVSGKLPLSTTLVSSDGLGSEHPSSDLQFTYANEGSNPSTKLWTATVPSNMTAQELAQQLTGVALTMGVFEIGRVIAALQGRDLTYLNFSSVLEAINPVAVQTQQYTLWLDSPTLVLTPTTAVTRLAGDLISATELLDSDIEEARDGESEDDYDEGENDWELLS